MAFFRSWRFSYLFVRELSKKYTLSLIGGFIAGFALTVLLGRIYPFLLQKYSGNIERIGMVGEFSPTTLPLEIQNKISFGLTEAAEDGTPLPSLAENWEATDSAKTFVFHLRDGASWHDGTQVKAQDINYNINGVTFEAPDAHTLIARLEDSYIPFPLIVSKPILKGGLIGFGPYKVSAIRLKGEAIEYLKLEPVTPDQTKPVIEYRFFRTEALASLAYKLGTIDIIADIGSPEQFRTWKNTQVIDTESHDRIVAVFFNINDQVLSEKSIRKALAYAIPEFPYTEANSPISATSWAYYSDIKTYTYDKKEALDQLAVAQVNGEELVLTITTFPQYVDVAQTIARSWKETLGIDAKVRVESALSGQFQVLVSAQEIPPDPDQYPFWHSQQTRTNITGYVNLKIDKLLEDGRRETDTDKRREIYRDFQRVISDEIPAVFLFYAKSYTVKRG